MGRRIRRGKGRKVVRFAERMIVQTKGRWLGEPLLLEEWQREFLDELYLVDETGKFIYREALLGVPRKNGKSTMAAAIALYGLLAAGEAGAEVYAAAASKDQARIVFKQAQDFIEASPKLRDHLTVHRNVITCKLNGGVFRVLSSDAPLQHGLNPSLVVIDELWAHTDPELYYALTTGQLARLNPLVVSITTAGFDRESIGWQVYSYGKALHDQGLNAMRRARFLFKWYSAPDDCDIFDREAIREANPSSWIDLDDLLLEAKRLPEFVFRRLHLNQWTSTEDAWITSDLWDACFPEAHARRSELPANFDVKFDPHQESWSTIDVGIQRDSTAMLRGQWHIDEDGVERLHVGHRIMDQDSDPGFGTPDVREAAGFWAGDQPGLREFGFDPYGFMESAAELEDRGVPMFRFDQGQHNMGPASEHLYELIKEGRLVVPNDPVARAQVLAAVVQATDRGWRISKRKSRSRIDYSIALAMLAELALRGKSEPTYGRAAW